MSSRTSYTYAGYAAIGSAAALALAYIFGPSVFPSDEDQPYGKAIGTVGLVNPANDCFINSVLQALAGLPSLGEYLSYASDQARERLEDKADGSSEADSAELDPVTRSLNSLVQVLNQSPAFRKTSSASRFIRALEHAFKQHLSRQQQDAQEFLQLVLEKLCDEYKKQQKQLNSQLPADVISVGSANSLGSLDEREASADTKSFPFEGRFDSHVQCTMCHFQPKPTSSSFLNLSLNVPQKRTATLDECLDGMFKVETIEDYRCAYCSVKETIQRKTKAMAFTSEPERVQELGKEVVLLGEALSKNPEELPAEIQMPDPKTLPKRRISRHITVSAYPTLLALHLSRSIFDSSSSSRKNYASLDFPEKLLMGGFDKRVYKLQCLITHKGGHNSGHYETFRRQRLQQVHTTKVIEADMIQRDESSGQISAPTTRRSDTKGKHRSEKAKGGLAVKWWRISDDRISECKTMDVLSMQKDAYLLFYELDEG